jgi:hypothetical protein
MSRLFRLSLVLASTASLGLSSPVQAGVIPWAYDALFGPVGSMQARAGYAPYYTGYSGNYGGGYVTGYAPYSVGYGYVSSGCGCSPCGGSCGSSCASGNCASGNCASGNCSSGNCASGASSRTTNAPPAGGLGPIPDPANNARSIESRLEVIEKALNIPVPRNSPMPKTYGDDGFNPRMGNGTDTDPNAGGGSTIPSRPARVTDPNDPSFEAPTQPRRGTFGSGAEPFPTNPAPGNSSGAERQESFKAKTDGIDLKIPDAIIPEKKPAPGGAAIEDPKPQTLRLDTRVTSRAVSPRERQSISVGFAKSVVAASPKQPAKRPLQSDATPNGMNLARQ